MKPSHYTGDITLTNDLELCENDLDVERVWTHATSPHLYQIDHVRLCS